MRHDGRDGAAEKLPDQGSQKTAQLSAELTAQVTAQVAAQLGDRCIGFCVVQITLSYRLDQRCINTDFRNQRLVGTRFFRIFKIYEMI